MLRPDTIHDDLDLLASTGRSLQEPVIDEHGVIEAPEISPSQIERAQENIVSEIEMSCSTDR